MRPDLSPGDELDRLLAYDNELRLEAYYGERSVFYDPRGVAPLGVIASFERLQPLLAESLELARARWQHQRRHASH